MLNYNWMGDPDGEEATKEQNGGRSKNAEPKTRQSRES